MVRRINGSAGASGLHRLANIRSVRAKWSSLFLDKDEGTGIWVSGIGGFKFKAPIHALEHKPLEREGAVAERILHAVQSGFAVQFVFHGGAHHGLPGLNFEFLHAWLQRIN